MLAPAALIVFLWVARSVVLSGCPIYPLSIGCSRLDWAVPLEKVTSMANWIYSWARVPGADPHAVLGNWEWLTPWIAREKRDLIGFGFPLATTVLFLGMFGAVRRKAPKSPSYGLHYREVALLAPIVFGIVFWFLTAPDARFGRSLFWMLSMSSAIIFLSAFDTRSATTYRRVATAVFIAANLSFLAYFVSKGPARLAHVSLSGWQPLPHVEVSPTPTASGLVVNVPEGGQQCWDSPIPCTPYFNPGLSLRVKGRLDRGFVDRGDQAAAR